ncbi:5-formyltetrahydrofolate cyclo-ligase [Aliirhizobium smilacinae]|uniref:5-formyltetrahydrofolate cyclo-ligase n=1 Tax=Aliirhizobium smilacinae TaxID=1395944 RepID=A0A5C4XGM7_9HYPH|nr:5-formyltetrahydrofolate cyclo-ligase [Rhizobium smilacinae]TNM62683.1 5-formyltetrahydrofolate cyclo-ligase [Rhizobium smilacinae]
MPGRSIKSVLRAERLAARDALDVAERVEKSLLLASHGMGAIDLDGPTVVSGFLPIRSEVDVRPLMDLLEDRGARICVPVVLDKQTIVFREFVHGAELVSGVFGTVGPGPEAVELDPQIMLVPLAAFDARGHRIGYGGGYYDRAIHRLQQKGINPRLIGIAFDCQEVASVPDEPHDIRLHGILTESGLRDLSDEAIAKIG